MVKKILGLLLFFGCSILVGAASSSSADSTESRCALLDSVPYLQLILHTSDYLFDPQHFNRSDYGRSDLRYYADVVRCYKDNCLRFLSGALINIHTLKTTPVDLWEQIQWSREVDADAIGHTFDCARKYLKPGTMQDAIRELTTDAHEYVLRKMFGGVNMFSVSLAAENRGRLEETVIRCIRLEKKSIKIAVRTIKDRRIQHALLQAVSRGVQLEIVIDSTCAKFLEKTGLSYKKADIIDSSMRSSGILFEENLDGGPIVITGTYYLTDYLPDGVALYSDSARILKDKQMYNECNSQFAYVLRRASKLMRAKCDSPENEEPAHAQENADSCVVSAEEVELLMQVLEAQRYLHLCSPIEVESAGSGKRQRTD